MRVQDDSGFIEFDLGDVTEIYMLFSYLEIDPSKFQENAFKENFVLMANLIKHQGKYVTKMELKDSDGVVVDSYNAAIKVFEFMPILNAMAMEIVGLLNMADKKKRSSKK